MRHSLPTCSVRKLICQIAILSCLTLLVGKPVFGQTKSPKLKKSPPEAVELYKLAAELQNNEAFEAGAEDWTKFLKKYPNDELTPKAQYYLGICELQRVRYQAAIDAFQTAINKYPTLETREDAYLNLGWCRYTLAKETEKNPNPLYEKTVTTFTAMLKEFPKGKGKWSDQAYFFLGESHYALDNKQAAIAAYDSLINHFPKSKLRADGIYALGTTHEELNKFPQAGLAYDLFLKEFAKHPLATEVRMRKAETILQAGLKAEAGKAGSLLADAEHRFAEVAAVPGFGSADHALNRQAYSALKQNKFEVAGVLYAKIPTQFSKSPYASNATVTAASCFYQAKKYTESLKWYQRVLDGNGSHAIEAAHWICKIHLHNNKPAEAVALASKIIPQAKGKKFEVSLKLDHADGLYELPGRREEALAVYLKIAADHPQHSQAPQALYNAAFTTLDLKKYDTGLQHSTKFLATYLNHSLTPDVMYVAAECRLQLNQFAEAEAAYRNLTAKYPSHREIDVWRVRLGLTLHLQKKYSETISLLTPITAGFKKPANIAESQFLIGAAKFYLEKYPAAEKTLAASLAADPKWRQADETMLLLSRCQRKANRYQDAIQTVKKLLATFPNSKLTDQAHFRLGEYSYAAGDYKTALAEYELTIIADKKSDYIPFAYYGKGWSQLKSLQYKPAVGTFTTLIEKHAKHSLIPDAYFARAMSRRQTGDHSGTIADVNQYLKSKPQQPDKSSALYERGLSEVALKNQPVATATFQQILKDFPQFAAADKVYYELAWSYKEQNLGKQSLANFSKLAADFPNSPLAAEAFFHVGEDHYRNKRYAEAIKVYLASKQKSGQSTIGEKAAYKTGWSYYQLKKYDEALKQFADQTGRYPQGGLLPDGLFMRAECQFKMEKYAEALLAYNFAKTAVAADKNASTDVKVLIQLHSGQSASQLKQWQKSLDFLQPILVSYPKTGYAAEVHFEIGRASQNLNKHDEAFAAYEKAAESSSTEIGARARFMMGELRFGQKKYAAAIRQYQRVMFGYGGKQAGADVKNWQAKSAYEAGRCYDVQIKNAPADKKKITIHAAIKLYTRVVEKHPNHPLVGTAKKRLASLTKLR